MAYSFMWTFFAQLTFSTQVHAFLSSCNRLNNSPFFCLAKVYLKLRPKAAFTQEFMSFLMRHVSRAMYLHPDVKRKHVASVKL